MCFHVDIPAKNDYRPLFLFLFHLSYGSAVKSYFHTLLAPPSPLPPPFWYTGLNNT